MRHVLTATYEWVMSCKTPAPPFPPVCRVWEIGVRSTCTTEYNIQDTLTPYTHLRDAARRKWCHLIRRHRRVRRGKTRRQRWRNVGCCLQGTCYRCVGCGNASWVGLYGIVCMFAHYTSHILLQRWRNVRCCLQGTCYRCVGCGNVSCVLQYGIVCLFAHSTSHILLQRWGDVGCCLQDTCYGVATISRRLKIIGLFCKRAL